MSVINRRNALLGWVAWNVAKQAAKRKAKQAAQVENGGGRGKLVPAAMLAAVGGAIVFWRRRHSGHGDEG
jgi:MYXO-CTERM domain-containing protein